LDNGVKYIYFAGFSGIFCEILSNGVKYIYIACFSGIFCLFRCMKIKLNVWWLFFYNNTTPTLKQISLNLFS
jgi:hypothetical protein